VWVALRDEVVLMTTTRSLQVVGLTVVVLLTVGCNGDDEDPEVANPASVFCVEQGGEVEIVDEEGGQVGYCLLPDGTRVEEWEYFRENSPSNEP
jgi:putative hemolysin